MRQLHTSLYSKKEAVPANETEQEMRERLKRKAMKNLYNENGVPFAPWVTRQLDIEVSKF